MSIRFPAPLLGGLFLGKSLGLGIHKSFFLLNAKNKTIPPSAQKALTGSPSHCGIALQSCGRCCSSSARALTRHVGFGWARSKVRPNFHYPEIQMYPNLHIISGTDRSEYPIGPIPILDCFVQLSRLFCLLDLI